MERQTSKKLCELSRGYVRQRSVDVIHKSSAKQPAQRKTGEKGVHLFAIRNRRAIHFHGSREVRIQTTHQNREYAPSKNLSNGRDESQLLKGLKLEAG
jgi:hypothetical protein